MKLFLLSLLAAPALLLAQTPGATPAPSGTPATTPGLWKCQLPGGTYEVAVRSMISVSSHEYVVDNVARVTEVNIDTAGSLVVRFYYLEPNAPSAPSGFGAATLERTQSLLTEAASRTGTDAWQKVVKSYPATTHAHTVEYRLTSKDQLKALFDSAETAFRLGRGGVYQVAAPAPVRLLAEDQVEHALRRFLGFVPHLSRALHGCIEHLARGGCDESGGEVFLRVIGGAGNTDRGPLVAIARSREDLAACSGQPLEQVRREPELKHAVEALAVDG